MPVPYACAALDDDVSFPPRKHIGGHARAPPGVLAWVGGVAWRCARVGLLYISYFIYFHSYRHFNKLKTYNRAMSITLAIPRSTVKSKGIEQQIKHIPSG